MDVRLTLEGGASTSSDLESLSDWLRGEPEFSGRVKFVGAAPRDGQLGTPQDALEVALGSGGAISVLALSLKVWLSQPRRVNLKLRIQDGDKVVELDAEHVKDQDVQGLVETTFDGAQRGGE